MAYVKGHYECDRCGKKVTSSEQTLCKTCNEWLENYVKRHKKR